MGKILGKYKILWILSIIAIFFETYRQLMSYSVVFRSYIYFLLWIALSIILANKLIRKINYIPFVIFLFILMVYIYRGGDNVNLKNVTSFIIIVVGYAIIPTVYLFYNRYCTSKQISICLLVVLIVATYTMICTAPIAVLQPGLIRETAYNEDLFIKLQQLGVMSYAFPHSVVFVIPALCFGMKYIKSKWIKIFCLIAFIETFVIVYMGEATTPLLLGFIAFFVSVIYNIHKSNIVNITRIVLIVFLILIFMNKSIIVYLLNSIAPLFEGTAFAEKLHELELSIGVGVASGGDLESRQDYMGNTFNAIINNLILGTINSKEIGGHNYLLDILASLGLVGFIPFVIWLFYVVRLEYRTLPKYCRFYYVIGITCFLIHALTKNMWSGEFFLYPFLILPCLLYFLGSNKEIKVKENLIG